MRDVKRQVEQGKSIIRKHERADLSMTELNQFFNEYHETANRTGKTLDALYEAIQDAFYMGVAVGSRNK